MTGQKNLPINSPMTRYSFGKQKVKSQPSLYLLQKKERG